MNLPNQLTLLRILLTPVFVLLLFMDGTASRIASFAVLIVASLTDWYDGYAARKFGDVSMWGRFLDPLADKILVSSAFICFSILGYIPAWMVLVVVIRDFLITGLRSYAVIKGRSIVTSMFAKVKTFGQFGVLYFIFLFHLFTGGSDPATWWVVFRKIQEMELILVLMYATTAITVLSGLIYLVGNRVHLRQMACDVYRVFVPSDV